MEGGGGGVARDKREEVYELYGYEGGAIRAFIYAYMNTNGVFWNSFTGTPLNTKVEGCGSCTLDEVFEIFKVCDTIESEDRSMCDLITFSSEMPLLAIHVAQYACYLPTEAPDAPE